MAEEEKSPAEQVKEIKAKAKIKDKTYTLIYDSFGEGLEPAYYWVLDFLREDANYTIEKTYDQFVSSESSGFFGELGMRRTALEKRAMEIMQTLGVIVKSVLQLVWDLKEFELRIDHYDKLKSGSKEEQEAANNALKAIWLTDVDIKKGRGSVNVLSQDLNFVTLRDAFMIAEDVKLVKDMDLNDRVKRILQYKIKEFIDWKKRSEIELKKRFQIEKAWLKSQVNAMNLYTRWARPYLIATKKLFPAESLETGMEDVVTAFDVMRIDLVVLGTKEINKIPQPKRHPKEIKIQDDAEKIYAAVEVKFKFRSTPFRKSPSESHYVHRGRTDMIFTPYVYSGAELKKVRSLEQDEVLQFLEGMTTESLNAMRDDLKKYVDEPITEKEKEILKKKPEFKIPGMSVIKNILNMVIPVKEITAGVKKLTETRTKKKVKTDPWTIKRLRKEAQAKATKDCWNVYNVYKESHKMIKW